ncbi:MAG: cytochrome c oxidase subunit 3 [Gammaproteobacteria bacterium]|nr:MAG: cytochrome c oxidase subunit 3 [Gammaproteobacteria bacterium]
MSTTKEVYYIPDPSPWPIIAALGIFTLLGGTVLWLYDITSMVMWVGLLIMSGLFYGWFGTVISESKSGAYNAKVDASFRQGMFWFIASEVFFFLTFFGCLFYLRTITLPYLGGEGQLGKSNMLWEGFTYTWPLLQLPDATNYVQTKEAMGPWGLPLFNTLVLLTSGATITWAHWGLQNENRSQLVKGMAMTVGLGVLFLVCQAYEYMHAYEELDLQLDSGIYGSTFYMLTGFHGFHVTMGTIMLFVILVRSMKGDFSPKHHFAFEGVAWYWHFVDVVWVGLYIFVYWL